MSELIVYKLSLDVSFSGCEKQINLILGETNSRELHITLTDGSEAVSLNPVTDVAVIRGVKADKTVVYNAAKITNAGIVIYDFTGQDATAAGDGFYEVQIIRTENGKNRILYSEWFKVHVDETLYQDEKITSVNEYTELTECLARVKRVEETIYVCTETGNVEWTKTSEQYGGSYESQKIYCDRLKVEYPTGNIFILEHTSDGTFINRQIIESGEIYDLSENGNYVVLTAQYVSVDNLQDTNVSRFLLLNNYYNQEHTQLEEAYDTAVQNLNDTVANKETEIIGLATAQKSSIENNGLAQLSAINTAANNGMNNVNAVVNAGIDNANASISAAQNNGVNAVVSRANVAINDITNRENVAVVNLNAREADILDNMNTNANQHVININKTYENAKLLMGITEVTEEEHTLTLTMSVFSEAIECGTKLVITDLGSILASGSTGNLTVERFESDGVLSSTIENITEPVEIDTSEAYFIRLKYLGLSETNTVKFTIKTEKFLELGEAVKKYKEECMNVTKNLIGELPLLQTDATSDLVSAINSVLLNVQDALELANAYTDSALSTKADKNEWKLIRHITVDENVTSVRVNFDENGNAFKFKEVRALFLNTNCVIESNLYLCVGGNGKSIYDRQQIAGNYNTWNTSYFSKFVNVYIPTLSIKADGRVMVLNAYYPNKLLNYELYKCYDTECTEITDILLLCNVANSIGAGTEILFEGR